MRKAKTVKGFLRQIKNCSNCKSENGVVQFGTGDKAVTVCEEHLTEYIERLNFENGKFTLLP